MNRNNWIVGNYSIRPAGKPDECFYCHAKKGTVHNDGCVIRTKTVVVSSTMQYIIEVPEDWDQHMIEFHRNESSSCADNVLDDMVKTSERLGCACGILETKYIRDADSFDEDDYKLYVNDCES